ncbi:hypothetical protein [Microcella indica]|uniref:hypothetical protein n=1 Tax=Microcella indica TaxID=2750620 RepID=UPI0015CF1913|nr:hypothetical protein [Microcella indica]
MRLALLAGPHVSDFVVIGGLNPDFLAPDSPYPHLGTTDVDLLFELGLSFERDDQDFEWLDQALEAAQFHPRSGDHGWQWNGVLGDSVVRLDLLSDVYDHPGQPMALPGATRARVQNFRGPAAALHDPIERNLRVPTAILAELPGAPDAVRLKFASLGGYLAAKSAAMMSRGEDKDAYDLAFVIMYAPRGPRAAAAAVAEVRLPPHVEPVREIVVEAVSKLADPASGIVGAVVLQLNQAGDDSPTEQLRVDVSQSAQAFLRGLESA